ncbi:YihY/virulence factor BrkB family protein [Nocardia yunnanensis]|uniref:YihY/virulence factor BrkB family protein n=1 Tax=Nocardia yunnanensis TaxID=2382165 RepID=A0A386ZBX4_9NOCA|nr:YihY/virulence factor BrkB family protein [Nocardia yunnanensis]AYF74797.1 YihY/virulence factor BrkB family protein [Nocardia yunnanensis]
MADSGGEDRETPQGPTDLNRRSWWGVLRRTVSEFQANKVTDWAAALTYYSVLSIFPGLLVLTALLGLLGPGATNSLVDTVRSIGPGSGTSLVVDAINQLQGSRSLSGTVAIIGVLSALWTASGYLGAFMRAANAIYHAEEGRPFYKTIPLRIGLTALMVLLIAACAAGVVATGSLARRIGDWMGVGAGAVRVWDIAKWPVLVILVSLAIALLYWISPNVRQYGFRWISPGSALAVILWIAASAGFTLYVTSFGSYNKVYGSLAGAVIFLVWLWLTNVAVLLGAQFDAELARARRMVEGHPEHEDPVLPPRDQPD